MKYKIELAHTFVQLHGLDYHHTPSQRRYLWDIRMSFFLHIFFFSSYSNKNKNWHQQQQPQNQPANDNGQQEKLIDTFCIENLQRELRGDNAIPREGTIYVTKVVVGWLVSWRVTVPVNYT